MAGKVRTRAGKERMTASKRAPGPRAHRRKQRDRAPQGQEQRNEQDQHDRLDRPGVEQHRLVDAHPGHRGEGQEAEAEPAEPDRPGHRPAPGPPGASQVGAAQDQDERQHPRVESPLASAPGSRSAPGAPDTRRRRDARRRECWSARTRPGFSCLPRYRSPPAGFPEGADVAARQKPQCAGLQDHESHWEHILLPNADVHPQGVTCLHACSEIRRVTEHTPLSRAAPALADHTAAGGQPRVLPQRQRQRRHQRPGSASSPGSGLTRRKPPPLAGVRQHDELPAV